MIDSKEEKEERRRKNLISGFDKRIAPVDVNEIGKIFGRITKNTW